MEKLYLIVNDRKELIEDTIIEKYNLKKGFLSPFTRAPIVDEYNDYSKEVKEKIKEKADLSNSDDGIDEMENGLSLSTSEILDIAAGVDSDMTP